MIGSLDARVETFAAVMEHELACNSHKGDPDRLDAIEHVGELLYHAAKLYMALRFGHREAALEFAADCGNHAWMAAHSAGVLDLALLTDQGEGGDLEDDDYSVTAWSAGYDDLKTLALAVFPARLSRLADELGAPRPVHGLAQPRPVGSSDDAGARVRREPGGAGQLTIEDVLEEGNGAP